MIYSYNKSQRDTLFLNSILIKNFTCFGQIYCPSSGDLILSASEVGMEQFHPDLTSGQYVCPKHVEFFTEVKLRETVHLVGFYYKNQN